MQQIVVIPVLLFFSSFVSLTHGWRSATTSDLYGKPCSNGSLSEGSKIVNCKHDVTGLVCSGRSVCDCSPGKGGLATMYDITVKACFYVPVPENDFRCETDYQCSLSSLGPTSKCNKDVGICECGKDDNGVDTQMNNNMCYAARPKEKASSFPSCRYDSDCTSSSLGDLSRCNTMDFQCECFDTTSGTKNPVGYYEPTKKCVVKRQLGEFCNEEAECKILHREAICINHPAYLATERLCLCPSDPTNQKPQSCGSGGGSEKGVEGRAHLVMLGFTTALMWMMQSVVS